MITCPSCHHNEIYGSLFCSECGAKLVTEPGPDPQKNTMTNFPPTPSENKPLKSVSRMALGKSRVSLHLIESGQILPLTERNVFSLGRVAEGQPIIPDIDLTPFKAYENGVSRLHALVKLEKKEVVLLDMNSSNGTFVNGNRLVPRIEQPLKHGDLIQLGKLKIQILLNPEAN